MKIFTFYIEQYIFIKGNMFKNYFILILMQKHFICNEKKIRKFTTIHWISTIILFNFRTTTILISYFHSFFYTGLPQSSHFNKYFCRSKESNSIQIFCLIKLFKSLMKMLLRLLRRLTWTGQITGYGWLTLA